MALFTGNKIITNGLILLLDASNPQSYPGSGTVWYDLSNGLGSATIDGDSEISNGMCNITGRLGRIALGEHDLSIYNNYTIDLLYRRNSVNDWGTGGDGLPSFYQGIYDYHWHAGHYITVANSTNASSTALTIFGCVTTLELGEWVHIVGITGLGGRAYINGVDIGATTTSAATLPKYMWFGNWDTSWASLCSIPSIRIYNRILTQPEVKQNFNALKTRFGL